MSALVWFRNDLRLLDNDAVLQACQNHQHVHFLVTPTLQHYVEHDWSLVKWDLYQRQLNQIGHDLADLGHILLIHPLDKFADCSAFLTDFCRAHQVAALYFNREYPLDEVNRDKAVITVLQNNDVQVNTFASNLLVAPEQIKNGKGEYYKVFTPFFKVWLQRIRENGVPAPYARNILQAASGRTLAFAEVHLSLPEYPTELVPGLADSALTEPLQTSNEWPVGEANIRKLAQQFVREQSMDYKRQRDFPSIKGTSRLSAYFEIGALSPRVAAHLLQRLSPEFPDGLPEGSHTWLSELAWREFYQHLMFHEPRLAKGEPFQAEQAKFPWRTDVERFAAWCNGKTGFPIVDAGMRELNNTGWMHNRVRMIVASFLVKDLHINWQWGERYFMRRLIDGSFAANNGGWQWSAGTGTDAAPYFRVFNPTSQGEKFDPSGRYIRKFVQELADVPDKQLHTPHQWLRQASLLDEATHSYPQQIVDHKDAREHFIATFKQVKNAE
ncbi:deoxyribodipyrimidine photo-lyase [Aliidiomarina sp.]|uniref:deoxyribodipyrimidine photo-lyase n=1 Tax=Aliidiomarina sp. TaxID=1872439 RepID=UPI003A4DD4DF